MNDTRPLILITNDDSINAPGVLRLVDCCPQDADIIVVAPKEQHSGQSSALTVGAPLRIESIPDYRDARLFTVSGTPVDCVKLALHAIVPRCPDLVLAGINHGSNSGCNVIYSGTMGAVLEGCNVGITSCGFSILHHSMQADFSLSKEFVSEIIASLLESPLPRGVCLNVNIPARVVPEGVKVCRAARGHWSEEYSKYVDPSGNPFYWLTGKFVNLEPDADDTDEYWLGHNYISVVPVAVDQTDQNAIARLAPIFDKQ
ncbi:MAG: 5'/3'-nucleotidase SurE [Bacteroidales bacterium]|nr:5'/3'-nucleotidase SurE [Bacteroidales bacterium]